MGTAGRPPDGDQLSQAEPAVIQDRQFNHFSGTDLALGDVVSAKISGLPKSASQGSLMWVLLVLVLLGAGFTFFYVRRRQRLQPVRVSPARQSEELLAELARLDDNFEGGKISEEAYRKARAQKKAQLVRLMQRSKEGDKHR